MPVLDTNFLIALRAEDEAAIRVLGDLTGQALIVPDVVAAEFLTDLADPQDRDAAMAALEQEFTIGYPDRAWVLAAASLRAQLRRKGTSLRRADHWIAAWALRLKTPVITRNTREFKALGADTRDW